MEKRESKAGSFWKMLLPMISVYLIQNLLYIFIMEIIFVWDMGTYTNGSMVDLMKQFIYDSTSGTVMGLVSVVYSIIGTILFGIWYTKTFVEKDRVLHPFKGIADNIPVMVAGLVVFSFGMQYLCIYLMNSIAAMFPEWLEEYETLLQSSGLLDENNILMALYAVILAPICEELAFRGLTYKYAKKIMPAALAIVVQALLFGAFHMNMLQSCYTFVVGLGLGYIMYRYDNILVTIFIHMIYNAIGTFLGGYLPAGGDTYYEYFFWFLGSLLLTYLGIVLLSKAAPGVKLFDNSSDN